MQSFFPERYKLFTGIIEEVGTVQSISPNGSGSTLLFSASKILEDIKLGSSVAVNGCCLTAVSFGEDWWSTDAVPETMNRTNLGSLAEGDPVNLERPLQASGRFGGHIVQGHIDGPTSIQSIEKQDDDSYRFAFALDPEWEQYVCHKGSITIDGISLTIAAVHSTSFEIAVIPHTWSATNLNHKSIGSKVNVEVDILAKYIERQLSTNNQSNLEVE
ncbi:MAG: riboflavin synthase [Acidimicrobiales bacterium]|nr:riboflavin synthase [Acidimicrobiales bacterium]